LLFAYAFDDEATEIVDIASGEHLPKSVLDALTDEAVTKTAFNAAFERICISRFLGIHLSATSWVCTAVQSAMLALPLSLDGVGEVSTSL
jgi:DNA polymerase